MGQNTSSDRIDPTSGEIPEFKRGEVQQLKALGGPTNRSETIEIPTAHRLPHPTKQVEDSLEVLILKNRYKMQVGNVRERQEAAKWAMDNNAVSFLQQQTTDGRGRVRFLN